MDMNHQMSNMRDMYMNNQDIHASNTMNPNVLGQDMSHNMMGQEMRSNMMNHNMLSQDMSRNMIGQEMRSTMRDMNRQNQVVMPNSLRGRKRATTMVMLRDNTPTLCPMASRGRLSLWLITMASMSETMLIPPGSSVQASLILSRPR